MPHYGNQVAYNTSGLHVLTVGMNPSVNDQNTSLFEEWGTGGEVSPDATQQLLGALSSYYEGSGQHPYFGPLTKVLKKIETSYSSETAGFNTALHVDLFKWSTTIGWGKLPQKVQQELTTLSVSMFLAEIQRLKPKVVILGVDDNKARQILPEVKWEEMKVFTKTTATYKVSKAWWKVLYVGRILFVQSTLQMYPFNFLLDEEKELIGFLISWELVLNNIEYSFPKQNI